MFPDSRIAAEMAMKRTKCTNVVHTLGKYATEQLANKLQRSKYSIIIDETTDCSVNKSCAIMVKYLDPVDNVIKTEMLDIIDVFQSGQGSTGENLYNLIINCLTTHNIPVNNMIGFASDAASYIMGKNNSVTSRLRDAVPGISIFKCVAHSIHLCASEAAKTLPRSCEDLLRNVYSFFSHSAKRTSELKEFQVFCNIKPHKLLHACATRWLSLHEAVQRILEQWRPLKLYFQSISLEERLLAVDKINESLGDPSIFCYLNFLNYILPHLNRFNLIFQSKSPTLHLIHDNLHELYRLLITSFCQEHIVTRLSLNNIDPRNNTLHKPLSQIYLGSELHAIFQMPDYNDKIDMIADIRNRCRTFFIVLCQEILKRFPLDDNLWRLAAYLHPKRVTDPTTRTQMPSLRDLIDEVPRVDNYDRQAVDDQWRRIQWHQFPEAMKNPKCDINDFYKYVMEVVDDNGEAQFAVFGKFALQVLSLPLSNADAERLFSKVNLIKRKQRNRLRVESVKTLVALSECAAKQGGCKVFQPCETMISYLTK